MPDLSTCREQYEPDARPDTTHTCCRMAGHVPPHLCGPCRSTWEIPGGPVAPPGPVPPLRWKEANS